MTDLTNVAAPTTAAGIKQVLTNLEPRQRVLCAFRAFHFLFPIYKTAYPEAAEKIKPTLRELDKWLDKGHANLRAAVAKPADMFEQAVQITLTAALYQQNSLDLIAKAIELCAGIYATLIGTSNYVVSKDNLIADFLRYWWAECRLFLLFDVPDDPELPTEMESDDYTE